MATLQRIRQKIIDREYYLSSHAEEELLDDELERKDIENAILKGRIEKKMKEDCAVRDIAWKDQLGMEGQFRYFADSKKMLTLS
ncbi:MAG: hypothetical protein H0X47_11310 [Nitrospirales bacterium]|nr:hypothetical protein [Nitrospirales bacterium]